MKKLLLILGLVFCFKPPVALADSYLVNINDQGFDPPHISVKQGETVMFKNTGRADHWPASDIHPTHQIYPEFDPKRPIKPGQSWQFKFERAGDWGMHDHLNPFLTGRITVAGDDKFRLKSPKLSWNEMWGSVKTAWQRLYFKFFPQELDSQLKKANLEDFSQNDAQIKYLLSVAGEKKVADQLLLDSGNGGKFDCHQQAHKLGRMSYALFGRKAFETMDTICHSGLIHGAMEAFLYEHGTVHLAADIKALCDGADNAFSRFECLHGVGHGVMAYTNYNMPWALDTCKSLGDDYSRSSCYGGVFMENVIVAEGNGVVPAHQTQWVSDDPLFPCDGVDQNRDVQVQCWMMQTSRMLDLKGFDFKKVAATCGQAPENMLTTCFQSMGRDAAGRTLRNAAQTDTVCKLAPAGFYRDCLRGALYVFIEFWGQGMTDQPHQLCKVLDDKDKNYCYFLLGERLPEIFGLVSTWQTDKQSLPIGKAHGQKDVAKIRQICGYSERNYQSTCLKAAGMPTS